MSPPPAADASAVVTATAVRVAGAYRKSPLDPVDRFSEVIFGLVMVLAFTCSLSVADAGTQGVREMLVAAVTCNLAWGFVDAVMYVLTSMAERTRRAAVLDGIRTSDPATARSILLGVLPEGFEGITDDEEADRIVARVRASPEPVRRPILTAEDLRGALASGILVVLATFPPTVPFLLVQEPGRALRVSNAVAVVCLFLAGYWLGRASGVRPWLLGLSMVVLGGGLVAVTIALGG
jgi:hypothetical protein